MDNFEDREDIISSKTVIRPTVANIELEQRTSTKFEREELLEPVYNLEFFLRDLKLSGRYHIQLLLLLVFLSALNAGSSINYVFTAENVGYRCKYSKCGDNVISKLEQNSTLNFKCHKYDLFDDNGTCTEDNFDVFNFTECFEWVYDKPNSFIAEYNLGCEDWKRTLVGTVHSIGFMIGLFILGPMSDKFGRKKIIIFTTLVASSAGILKSMVPSYWMFIVLEIIEPLFGDNYTTIYTMAVEMVTTKDRPVVILIFALFSSLGEIILALIAYLSTNWRTFLVLFYTPSFLVIAHIFWLDESLRWLLSKGKIAEAEKIIRKAVKKNKMEVKELKFVNLKSEEKSIITLRKAIHVTFSSRKLLIRFLLCLCIWFTSVFNVYTLMINSVSLEGNKYINFGLVSIFGSVSGVILFYVLTKFQRKRPLIFTLLLTAAFCVSQPLIPKGNRWLSMVLYGCGKLSSNVALRVTYLYTAELFPTYTRNTMLGLCSALGRTGSIIAPLTPLLLVYWSGLPSLLVGILSLVTAFIVTLMPDTATDDVLPDNVKQAEEIDCK